MIRKQLIKAVVGFLCIANKGLAFFLEKLKRKKNFKLKIEGFRYRALT